MNRNIIDRIDNYLDEEALNEGGIRNIKSLIKDGNYKECNIFFHQDLDGVTSAIAIKNYLERYGIMTIAAHMINYGSMEYAVSTPDANMLNVLVDFAHGKGSIMHLHTDHHDQQIGVDKKSTSTSFVHTPSNAEALSAVIPPNDAFPQEDVQLISMVDSADFAKNDIYPDEVMNSIFKYDKKKSVLHNRTAMGLVVNKLLLTYKNKKNFLETLVLKSKPSLISMFNEIVRLAKENGYKTPDEIQDGTVNHIENQRKAMTDGDINDIKTMKTGQSVQIDNIIVKYEGSLFSKQNITYDRYTVFKLYPDAEYLVITWPLGLIQTSVNPFKKGRNKHHLGKIVQEALIKFKGQLSHKIVSLDHIKNIFEKDAIETSMGFNFNDFVALFSGRIVGLTDENRDKVKELSNKKSKTLEENDHKVLKEIYVSAWDLIQAQSGGHPNISNLSGLNFLGKEYTDFMREIAVDIVKKLSGKHLE